MATAGGCGQPYQSLGFVTKTVSLFDVTEPSQGVYVASASGFNGNVLGIAVAPGLFEELGQFAQRLYITVVAGYDSEANCLCQVPLRRPRAGELGISHGASPAHCEFSVSLCFGVLLALYVELGQASKG